MARSPRHPTVTAIRLMVMATGAVTAIQLMVMATGAVMAIRLMAMATGAATAIRLMAMATGAVIRLTGLTDPPITPLFDAISMPPLLVSIVIVIRTNAGHVRALDQAWTVRLMRAVQRRLEA